MTEREKIIKVIDEWADNAVTTNKFDGASVYNPHNAAGLADALIAAGLKFDRNISYTATLNLVQLERINDLEKRTAKAAHRAERAERALQKFAENITCEDCPFFSDCDSSEKMEDLIHANYCFAEYLKQAEKELKEERQDD